MRVTSSIVDNAKHSFWHRFAIHLHYHKKIRAMVGYQNVEHVKDKINIKLFARFTIPANQKSAWIVHQKCEKLLEKWGLKRVKCYKEMYTLEILF
jgi:hypothetical protein